EITSEAVDNLKSTIHVVQCTNSTDRGGDVYGTDANRSLGRATQGNPKILSLEGTRLKRQRSGRAEYSYAVKLGIKGDIVNLLKQLINFRIQCNSVIRTLRSVGRLDGQFADTLQNIGG